MRSKIIKMVFTALFFFGACEVYAQEGKNVEKYIKALLPSGASSGATKGIAGTTSLPENQGKPSVTMHLEFEFNSDRLTPVALKDLDDLGRAFQDPVVTSYRYRIEGYTDNIGSDAYNLDLSRRRALRAVDYLVRKFYLQRDQFDVQGFGKNNPVASNDTDEGRQQNRRVVIVNTLDHRPPTVEKKPKMNVNVIYTRSAEVEELHDNDTLTQRDNYAIIVTPKTAAYVYIYQVDSLGNPTQLFPNQEYSQSSNYVEPGREYRIPTLGKWFVLDENKGEERILVIAQKDEKEDPQKICQWIMGEGSEASTIIASSGGATKGVGSTRIYNPEDQRAKIGTTPPPNMANVFVWMRSFNHQ